MTQAAFDHWAEILRAHFPGHPAVVRLGTTFLPRLPEEAEAKRAAHDRAHPVAEMKDEDGARRRDPDLKDVTEWLELMKRGDTLVFRRRDGGSLKLTLDRSTHSAECLDVAGSVQAEASSLDNKAVQQLSRRYLSGDVAGCVRQLRSATLGPLERLWRRVVDPS
jgi:hypothetical protein